MKLHETFDDRHPLLHAAYLHYGVISTNVAFAAGVDSADCVILATANVTVTLPPASGNKGTAFYIKKAHAAAGSVTVARANPGDAIDGAVADVSISTAQAAILIVSDGATGWWIIADKVAVSPF